MVAVGENFVPSDVICFSRLPNPMPVERDRRSVIPTPKTGKPGVGAGGELRAAWAVAALAVPVKLQGNHNASPCSGRAINHAFNGMRNFSGCDGQLRLYMGVTDPFQARREEPGRR